MVPSESTTVRLKVSPEIARIVKPGAPRDVQLEAARGALPLVGKDLLTVLFFLCNSRDVEIRKVSVGTLRGLPATILVPVLRDDSLPPQLLELMVRTKISDTEVMEAIIKNQATAPKTLLSIAGKASNAVLECLAGHQELLSQNPGVVEAIIANPAAGKALKLKLGWQDPEEPPQRTDLVGDVESDEADEGRSPTEIESLLEEAEEEGMSKYQISMGLKVAEKIKMGLTGDKEWRALMIKEANKLIQGAVMKNPRITDGEVLMVAKNKTSSDDLIRLILLNKDWVKNYEIKKALLVHPKTPPPKALRFVSYMTTKDIKDLAKSRQVSTIVSTAARKELEKRLKKAG